MIKPELRRWTFLLSALFILIALNLSAPEEEGLARATQVRHKPAVVPRVVQVAAAEAVDVVTEQADALDPFAPRGWQSPPAAEILAAPVIAAPPAPVALAMPAEPVAPPLPYTFVGQMEDAGRTVVYLSRGGQEVLIARPGETLDATYKVIAMDARQIEFEHLPTGTKQTISIPAQ